MHTHPHRHTPSLTHLSNMSLVHTGSSSSQLARLVASATPRPTSARTPGPVEEAPARNSVPRASRLAPGGPGGEMGVR